MIGRFSLILVVATGLALTVFVGLDLAWAGRSKMNFSARGFGTGDAFAKFVRSFRPVALKAGISAEVYDRSMAGVVADGRVEKLSNRQPEFNTPVWAYLKSRVTQDRITRGRANKRKWSGDLGAIERRFGVDQNIFLAIWGMETSFGRNKGSMSVIRSLATFAYRGRRQKFGRGQLLAALKILQSGDVRPNSFVGSWAGAMGHTQFIPSSYNAHAVDWNGDGRRDVWNSVPDALASTANYLFKAGWRPGKPWGWEVILPARFDYRFVDGGWRPVQKWANLGVRPARAKRFGVAKDKARLILPAGAGGPAFLITGNFKAIMAYNSSISYALGVSLLADAIAGRPGLVRQWPVGDKLLSRSQRRELQVALTGLGFDTGGQNGYFGRKTIAAIRSYQRKAGLPADGYANERLLQHIKAGNR